MRSADRGFFLEAVMTITFKRGVTLFVSAAMVGQATFLYPAERRLDLVVVPIPVSSTATASFSQSITDTTLDDRVYPRPEPERPRATQRST
jgi:hypothetical protein